MIQRGEQARFPRESGPALRIRGESRGQNLDRHIAPEFGVARAIHLAHAPGAEKRRDLVWSELPAHHIGVRLVRVCHYLGCGTLEEPGRGGLMAQQGVEFLLQRRIPRARILQERATLRRRPFQGCVIQA